MTLTEFITVFGIGIGLSMDAFAVSITQGACLDIRSLRYPLILGITFGIFQAVMPLAGWILGSSFSRYIAQFDHWIAFVLLGIIGGKLFLDGFIEYREKRKAQIGGYDCAESCVDRLRLRSLLMMGLATSIDALAVGVTFGMLDINIWIAIIIIGIITFLVSASGVFIGKKTGPLLGDKMEMIGGVILFSLGLKILVEHILKGV
jgi:manganese efflux pump family protein